ncbi:MAG: ribose-5-phosphate isomerase RpiA [Myxococcota bacterium]
MASREREPNLDVARTTTSTLTPGMVRAAEAALDEVEDGMTLGLGTGRSAEAFIRALGARVATGLNVRGVVTSRRSEHLARSLEIPLCSLADVVDDDGIDLAIDGADEVTDALALTKGLGGALLRERVVASVAARFIVVATPVKRVARLGTRAPIPIEVVAFATPLVLRALRELGAEPTVRHDADGTTPYRTDNGNPVLDAAVAPLEDPHAFDAAIRAIPGVIDTGLFLDLAAVAHFGHEDGTSTRLEAPGARG